MPPADAATIGPGPVRNGRGKRSLAKYGLRGIALGYLLALLLIGAFRRWRTRHDA